MSEAFTYSNGQPVQLEDLIMPHGNETAFVVGICYKGEFVDDSVKEQFGNLTEGVVILTKSRQALHFPKPLKGDARWALLARKGEKPMLEA